MNLKQIKTKLDLDYLYQIMVFVGLFLMIIRPSLYNELLVGSIIFFILKIKKENFKFNNFDILVLLVIFVFGLSYIGAKEFFIKDYIRFIKVFILFLVNLRFKYRNLKEWIQYFLLAMSFYGLVRMIFNPMQLGSIRPYPYMNFIMDSSLVACMALITAFLFILKNNRIMNLSIIIVNSYIVFIGQVRASYVSIIILAFLYFLLLFLHKKYKKRKVLKYFSFAIIILIFSFKLIPEKKVDLIKSRVSSIMNIKNNESNLARLTYWKQSIETFKENYILGIGLGNFNKKNVKLYNPKYVTSFSHAHNEYFSLLSEVGLLGMFMWIALKIYIFVLLLKVENEELRIFSILLFLNLEVHNMFDLYLKSRYIYIYTYAILGIILSSNIIINENILDYYRKRKRLSIINNGNLD